MKAVPPAAAPVTCTKATAPVGAGALRVLAGCTAAGLVVAPALAAGTAVKVAVGAVVGLGVPVATTAVLAVAVCGGVITSGSQRKTPPCPVQALGLRL
jgi:hypothetical protein